MSGFEVLQPERGFVDGAGLRLSYGFWPGEGEPVLALHGQTANHQNFVGIASRVAGRVPLFAPDMRGRGDSDRPADGPYDFDAYADDIAAAMDARGMGPSVVIGHSMGAWVGAALAARHPGRVTGLFLLDGGYPLPAPPGMTYETLYELILAPSLERLRRDWATVEEYLDYWRPQPTWRPEDWTPFTEAFYAGDLGGEPPALRAKAFEPAVKADWFNMADRDAAAERLLAVKVPVRIVTAQYGVMWGADPIQIDDNVEAVTALADVESAERIEGTTHYTIAFADPGVGRVADSLVDFAARLEA